MTNRLFTSESVTEGHPDKICDAISDAILDSILEKDPNARVGCETVATSGLILVTGEITTRVYIDIETIVRNTLRGIGYNCAKYGFDADTCAVLVSLKEQSPDIAIGVDNALEARIADGKKDDNDNKNDKDKDYIEKTGAGDQGMMFGFACDETDALMPMPIYLAHKLAKRLTQVRKDEILPYLRPDGKTQVTVQYDDQDKPLKVTTVVVSTQHAPEVEHSQITKDIIEHVIKPIIPEYLLDDSTSYYINPTGRFVIGGPKADAGLTGRKIIVDTYGGYASHGGGCFSGKDPTKVDRSAAYMARYVAKNIVAAGLSRKCEIEIAYAIGVSRPVSIHINTHGTGIISDSKIQEIVTKHFDLRPAAIIKYFDLCRPIYKQTSAYGHFGRNDLELPWEKTDMVDILKKEI